MARPTRKTRVNCHYFHWLLGTRNGVYFADGRSNRPHTLGRYTLDAKDYQVALESLKELDLKKAIELGIAEMPAAPLTGSKAPELDHGIALYKSDVERPAIMGGPGASTAKRYRAVIEKFLGFCRQRGITHWGEVTNAVVRAYGKWLDEQDYHPSTMGFELNLIKGIMKFLVAEGHLPTSALLKISVKKITTTTTYCYSKSEVKAIIDFCGGRKDLHWFGVVATALALTGMRISELANLRWSQVDLERRVIMLFDETRSARRSELELATRTKSHKCREIPIHRVLRETLNGISKHRDGYVMHGPLGGRLKPDTVRNVLLREILPALTERFPKTDRSLGIAAGRIHSFRHFYCSLCAEAGMPEQKLKSILGHSSSEMIRRYYHPQHEESLKQIDRLSLECDSEGTGNGPSLNWAV